MDLFRTIFWSGIATIVRIFVGIVLNKVLAVFVGPGGVALLGQFSSYSSMLTQFGTGGINTGVTKYIAEYSGDTSRQKKVVITSLSIAFYSSLVFGCLNYVFAEEISLHLFNTNEYKFVFRVFAISMVFSSLNLTLLSILNGYKKIRLYISLGILNNFISLAMTYVLAVKYQVQGALLSVVLTQSIVSFTTLFIARRFDWFNLSFLKATYDKVMLFNLSKFALMSLVSACVVPVSQIIVRKYLVVHLSLVAAGYWQAVVTISGVYLMVITTSLSTYYLPRLSETSNNAELRREICRGYKVLLPVTFILASGIYAMRDFIILILFTPQFVPMRELFLFQLIGDVLRISSWLLGYLMYAKAMTRLFIISEVAFSFSFVVFTYFFVSHFGLVGITYAYALNYLIYLMMVYVFIWRKLLKG